MNTSKEKEYIKNLINKRVVVINNLGRNKEEYSEGIIKKIYKYVFVLETDYYKKSFSYPDLLTKDVIVKRL